MLGDSKWDPTAKDTTAQILPNFQCTTLLNPV